MGPSACRPARWCTKRRPIPVSKAVLTIKRGTPRCNCSSSGRGSASAKGRCTRQPGQSASTHSGHCRRDSSRATGSRCARACSPSRSVGSRGCSSHCKRGSQARRSAQPSATGRSQPPFASRRSPQSGGSCSNNRSSNARSSVSASTATFHFTQRGWSPACFRRVSSAGSTAFPAGKSSADAGASSQARPSRSAKAMPKPQAKAPGSAGNWSSNQERSSSPGSWARTSASGGRSGSGVRQAAGKSGTSPHAKRPSGASRRSSHPRRSSQRPWALTRALGRRKV